MEQATSDYSIDTSFLRAVHAEMLRAQTKHPTPMRSAHEGYAILKEEVDEMWDAIKADNLDDAKKEAVQVAAMALRFLHDSYHGFQP